MIQLAPRSYSADVLDGIFTRQEFLEEFAHRYFPGQHVILFGPTGRGKTTLMGQMLSTANMPKTDGLLTIQNGPDLALQHIGKPVKQWPPTIPLSVLMYDERPFKRRYQPLITKRQHFITYRRQASRILLWMFGRRNWTIVVPDLQLISDPSMFGLGKEMDMLIITLRKRFSSVWMDAQAPRWMPRSVSDQPSHVLVWKTRDEALVRRLAQIVGVNVKSILEIFQQMEMEVLDNGRVRADTLWIDSLRDEYYIVKGR